MSDLLDLAARCEAAEGPDANLDLDIHGYIRVGKAWTSEERSWMHFHGEFLSYTASLDAAMMLVPENHNWLVRSDGAFANVSRKDATNTTTVWEDEPTSQEWLDAEAYRQGHRYGNAATPALALCAAALRARAAQ